MLPFQTKSSRRETSFFHLFRTVTLQTISGLFDKSFWNVSVVQATGSSEAVWRAALATTAIHERSKIVAGTEIAQYFIDSYYQFATYQYGLSIRCLLESVSKWKTPSRADKEAILVANALYVAICNILGNSQDAALHIGNGVHLFHQWKFWESIQQNCTADEENPLIALFVRFTGMYLSSSPGGEPLPWAHLGLIEGGQREFMTIQDAYNELHSIYVYVQVQARSSKTTSHTSSHEPPQLPEPDHLHTSRVALRNWRDKFNAMESSRYLEPVHMLSLRLHELATGILVHVDGKGLGPHWDTLQSLFDEAMEVANQLFTLERDATAAGEEDLSSPALAFAARAWATLFRIACSCRHQALSFRFLAMLRSWPRRDASWPTRVALWSFESKLLLEMSGQDRSSCLDAINNVYGECMPGMYVCTSHRVMTARIQFVGARTMELNMRTYEDAWSDRPGRTTKMSW